MRDLSGDLPPSEIFFKLGQAEGIWHSVSSVIREYDKFKLSTFGHFERNVIRERLSTNSVPLIAVR